MISVCECAQCNIHVCMRERDREKRGESVFLLLHVSCFIGLHSARSASLTLIIYPIKHENNLSEIEA